MLDNTTETRLAIHHLAGIYEQAALWMVRLSAAWLKTHDDYKGIDLNVDMGGERIYAQSAVDYVPFGLDTLALRWSPVLSNSENADMCARVYGTICSGFPGATVESSLCLCDLPQCGNRLNGSLSVCVPFGKKWVCRECESAIEDAENIKSRQRAMVTPKLRLEIFTRDGFACQVCRRTSTEDKVKLVVDHVVPVAVGGKTVKDNLQTLCFECNSGKSDSLL